MRCPVQKGPRRHHRRTKGGKANKKQKELGVADLSLAQDAIRDAVSVILADARAAREPEAFRAAEAACECFNLIGHAVEILLLIPWEDPDGDGPNHPAWDRVIRHARELGVAIGEIAASISPPSALPPS